MENNSSVKNSKNNEIENRNKFEILDFEIEFTDYYDIEMNNQKRISKEELAIFGLALEPLYNSIVNEGSPNGLVRISVPKGMHLKKMTKNNQYFGALFDNKTNELKGQVSISPVYFNPQMLAIAMAYSKIESKFNEIIETQKEILNFLEDKEKSVLRGNLLTLIDIQNNLKFNVTNETYKVNKHIQVQEIKRESEQAIIFYEGVIHKKNKAKNKITTKKDILMNLNEYNSAFVELQLANYIYSFATFLETFLLDNTNVEYIRNAYSNINKYNYKYRKLYTQVYSELQNSIERSLENFIFKGVKGMEGFIDKTSSLVPEKIKPKIEGKKMKTLIEDALVSDVKSELTKFTDNRDTNTFMFEKQLEKLEQIYSNDISILTDGSNVYFETSDSDAYET